VQDKTAQKKEETEEVGFFSELVDSAKGCVLQEIQLGISMAKGFARDTSAQTGILKMILGLVLGLIFIGYVFPVGMEGYHAANTTAWTSNEQSIFNVLGIFAVLGLMIGLIGISIRGMRT